MRQCKALTFDAAWVKGWYCRIQNKSFIILREAEIVSTHIEDAAIDSIEEIIEETVCEALPFQVAGNDGEWLQLFENDIIVDWNTGIKDKCSWPIVVKLTDWRLMDELQNGFVIIEKIGNVIDNPKLAEKEYKGKI